MLRPTIHVACSCLLLLLASCSRSSPAPPEPAPSVPSAPVLSDLSGLDPAAAVLVEEKFDAARTAPDDAEARATLAMAYQANGMDQSAADTFEQALELDDDHARWWYLLALARKALDQDEAAMTAIAHGLDLDASYPPAHVRQGLWWLEQGDFEAARRSFTAGLAADASFINARIGLARVDLQLGETARAIETLQSVRIAAPADGYVQYLLGTAFRQSGRLDEAQPLLEAGTGSSLSWRGLDPWIVEMLQFERGYQVEYLKALDLINADRMNEAITHLQSMQETYPEDIPVLTSLAGAYSRTQQLEPALATLNRAAAIDPDQFAVQINLGLAYHRMQQPDKALEHTERAIALNPELGHGHHQKGQILFVVNRFPEAEAALRASVERDPGNVPSWMLLVHAQDRQQDVAGSIETLRTMIERFPALPDSYLMLAQIYQGTGQLTAAQEVARLAGQRLPDEPRVQQLLQSLGLR